MKYDDETRKRGEIKSWYSGKKGYHNNYPTGAWDMIVCVHMIIITIESTIEDHIKAREKTIKSQSTIMWNSDQTLKWSYS